MSFLGFQIFKALVIEFISIILSVRNVKMGLAFQAADPATQRGRFPSTNALLLSL